VSEPPNNFYQKEQGGDSILQMVYIVLRENSLSDPPSPVPEVLRLHRGVTQMTDCSSTGEDEPSSIEVVNNKEYGRVDTAPALSDNEDFNSHIQSILKNLHELPIHAYRSMIVDRRNFKLDRNQPGGRFCEHCFMYV